MKKTFKFSLAMLSILSLASCGDEPSNPVQPEKQVEKPVLMFEIDEGLGGYEFVAGCKTSQGAYDYDKIDIVLNNVYAGLSHIDREKYVPAVHIYPTWYYKASGWRDGVTDGMQKWSDDFIYAMDFFKEKDIKVYLEYMSSTVYVAQNGENGKLPRVDINLGLEGKEKRDVWGVPCDLQSLTALKNSYPDIFLGVRYHELLGTNSLASNGDPHACLIYSDDVKYFSHEIANMGLDIVWSDHSFALMYSKPEYSFWEGVINEIKNDVGDALTLMIANNTSDVIGALKFQVYDQIAEKFPGVSLGLSNQAWYLDVYILSGTKCNEYSSFPPELAAGFTQKAIKKGSKYIQFEPYFHLWNYTRQSINPGASYTAGGIAMNGMKPRYEEIQSDALDYSPRLELYRLIDYLNDDTFEFENVERFFDDNLSKVKADSFYDKPVMFEQTTINFVGDEVETIDKYNYDSTKWLNQSKYRFTEKVDLKNAICANRVSYSYGPFDDFIVVHKKDGKNVGTLYNAICAKVFEDETTFADNSDGEFVGFTSANLIQGKTKRNKDADELIVYRRKDNVINVSLYKANQTTDKYVKVTGSSASIIDDFLGTKTLPADNFVGLYGVRNDKAIGKSSYLRNLGGLYYVVKDNNKLIIKGKKSINTGDLSKEITLQGDLIGCTTADCTMDLDSADDFVIAYKKDGKNYLNTFTLNNKDIFVSQEVKEIGISNVKFMFNTERFIYQNSTDL